MNEEEIKKTVCNILKNIAPDTNPDSLKLNDNIRETLEIDSFDYLRFITEIDKIMKINIPEEDYTEIQKLNGLINYISRKIKPELNT